MTASIRFVRHGWSGPFSSGNRAAAPLTHTTAAATTILEGLVALEASLLVVVVVPVRVLY